MATEKQKRALKLSLENGGNMSKAMRDAGYTAASAKTPQKLTESKGWQELLDEYLPEEMLLGVHKEGIFEEDGSVRHKYLDTAYKLRGSYATEKVEANVTYRWHEDDNDSVQTETVGEGDAQREDALDGTGAAQTSGEDDGGPEPLTA